MVKTGVISFRFPVDISNNNPFLDKSKYYIKATSKNKADQFGLAQLHQLRGRVGRGKNQGTCILLFKDKELIDKIRPFYRFTRLTFTFSMLTILLISLKVSNC